MYLLGLDVGTTSCKAMVFNLKGEVLGYSYKEYGIICEHPNWAEQDPVHTWNSIVEVIRGAISKSQSEDAFSADQIGCMSISVQGEAIIPLDQTKNPINNAILGMDYRALEEAIFIRDVVGDERLFFLTGNRAHPITSLPKMMWLKRNRPEVFLKTKHIVTYSDFIYNRLGLPLIIDFPQASRTLAFDIHSKSWSDEILGKVDIDSELLSKPVPAGQQVGNLSKNAASELGLSTHVKIVTGGHDQTCAAVGAGVIKEGIALDSHGTCEVLGAAFKKPMLTEDFYNSFIPCLCHTVNDLFYSFSFNQVSGLLLKWFRDNFYKDLLNNKDRGQDIYDLMTENLGVLPSSVIFLPHMIGSGTPWCDLESKGTILGLTMNSTRSDLTKAILDSLTYELRINKEVMEKSGVTFDEIRFIGGASKSSNWAQVKANILQSPLLTMKIKECGCLGTALLAGVACGFYASIEEAVETAVKVEQIYTPNQKHVSLYEDKYQIYKTIYPILKELNKNL